MGSRKLIGRDGRVKKVPEIAEIVDPQLQVVSVENPEKEEDHLQEDDLRSVEGHLKEDLEKEEGHLREVLPDDIAVVVHAEVVASRIEETDPETEEITAET